MTSKEALFRIKTVLGLQTFGLYKTEEGVELKTEAEIEVGSPIYSVSEQGELPVETGVYTLEDGLKVSVEDGIVKSLDYTKVEEEVTEEETAPEGEVEIEVTLEDVEEEEKMTEEVEEKKFVEVSLIDGTIVVNDEEELAEGQDLYIQTEDGRTPAPDGTHETETQFITTEAGKIIKIEDKEEVTEETIEEIVSNEPSLEEVMNTFTKAFETLRADLNTLKTENEELKAKFSAFSNEPAGKPVYSKKSVTEAFKAQNNSRLETLIKLRNNK